MSDAFVAIHRLERRRHRLNGWQRLWLLITILWGLFVALLGALYLEPLTSSSIKDRWAEEKATAAWRHFRESGELPSEYRQRVFKNHSDEEIINGKVYSLEELLKQGFDPAQAEPVTDEDYLRKVAALENEYESIKHEYEGRLASAAREFWQRALVLLMIWFFPTSFLFVLGIAIGWVRRGFRQPQ